MNDETKFKLNDSVKLIGSTENGIVIGVAFYSSQKLPSYLIRYVGGDGRLVENWWTEDAVEAG